MSKLEGFIFVDFDLSVDPAASMKKKRKEIRTLAALVSAEKRKATIAEREELKAQRSRSSSIKCSTPTETRSVATTPSSYDAAAPAEPSRDIFTRLQGIVSFQSRPEDHWHESIESASMAHKAIRTMLWSGIISNATLFQAAIFVSSTHSNSCGLPSTMFQHGVGVLLLRGASFEAVHAAVMAGTDPLTPVAIAMLAGWERKFGDRASYDTHMLAWQSLQLPCDALLDTHVSTLVDVTLEIFREELGERAISTESTLLPPGLLGLFSTHRPETRSLLDISSRIMAHNPRAPDSIMRMRALGIENIAWSPYHTYSSTPNKAVEDSWDPVELNALYHLRACLITISALQMSASHVHHGTKWMWDWETAIAIHAVSCQHLNTDALLDTPFRHLAVWSRFIMCALARDPDRDDIIRGFLQHLDITNWQQLSLMLEKHVYIEALFGASCLAFSDLLLGGHG